MDLPKKTQSVVGRYNEITVLGKGNPIIFINGKEILS